MTTSISNIRPNPDPILVDIAKYVSDDVLDSALAYETARHCLMDSLGCAALALRYPECAQHLGANCPRHTRPTRNPHSRYTV